MDQHNQNDDENNIDEGEHMNQQYIGGHQQYYTTTGDNNQDGDVLYYVVEDESQLGQYISLDPDNTTVLDDSDTIIYYQDENNNLIPMSASSLAFVDGNNPEQELVIVQGDDMPHGSVDGNPGSSVYIQEGNLEYESEDISSNTYSVNDGSHRSSNSMIRRATNNNRQQNSTQYETNSLSDGLVQSGLRARTPYSRNTDDYNISGTYSVEDRHLSSSYSVLSNRSSLSENSELWRNSTSLDTELIDDKERMMSDSWYQFISNEGDSIDIKTSWYLPLKELDIKMSPKKVKSMRGYRLLCGLYKVRTKSIALIILMAFYLMMFVLFFSIFFIVQVVEKGEDNEYGMNSNAKGDVPQTIPSLFENLYICKLVRL